MLSHLHTFDVPKEDFFLIFFVVTAAARVIVGRNRVCCTRGRVVAVAYLFVTGACEAVGNWDDALQLFRLIVFVLFAMKLDVPPHANFGARS